MLDSAAALNIPGLVLDEELGRGSHSVVFRARRGQQPCAVKIARAGHRASRWFRREAAALARVCHEGVPRVLEVGEVAGRPYIVMELVEGETLARRLAHRSMTAIEVIELGLRLAAVAQAIHARGLVHRDIKPHNIVVDAAGVVRLVDFGLVTQVHAGGQQDVAGTRSYAAPEQIHTPQLVDARSDLHAIGRVLLECLANGTDALSARVRVVLLHLVAEKPGDRYASAVAFASDLERVAVDVHPLGPSAVRPASSEALALVGRAAEQRRLRAAWSGTRGGRGGVLLLEGPPGSGKSRLLRELVRFVGREEGVLRLFAQGGSPAPLAALRQLVDQHVAELEQLPPEIRAGREAAWRRAAEGPASALVASLSPGLAQLLGEPAPSPGREHEAFVEAMAATFVGLARAAPPMLLCIDDLQWLDPVSREVLVRVALGAADVPLLVVAAARTDARNLAPVERFIRTLGQDRLQIIGVRGLSESDLGGLVAAYLGTPGATDEVDGALARRVVGLSEGTPLGALAILEALIDGGALLPHWGGWRFDPAMAARIPLPRGASALLRRRLDALPPATVRVLQAVAVLGPYVDLRRLAAVVGVAVEDLGLALFEARRAGIVDVDDLEGPRFVHESVRETLIATSAPDELRTVHHRVARTLEAEGSADPAVLFAAARHYASGEPERDPERVFAVARAAAEQASASLDHETALPLFELARVGASHAGIELDVAFHREVAECRIRAAMLDEALSALDEALALTKTNTGRVEVLARIAWVHQLKGDAGEAWVCLARAFEMLGEPMPTERARAVARTLVGSLRTKLRGRLGRTPSKAEERLSLLCALHYQNARLGVENDKPIRILQSALAILSIGERIGLSATMALAQGMYGMFMTVLGRREAGRRFIAEAEANAKALDDAACLARVHQFACLAECFAGNMQAALERAESCLGSYGHWIDVTDYCLVARSMQLIESIRGRPHEALAWLERALARTRRQQSVPTVVREVLAPEVRAAVATLGQIESTPHGDLIEALPVYEDLRGVHQIASWGARALLFAEAGGPDEEIEALAESFEREGYNPARVHLVVAEYYICIAHVRARQCAQADERAFPAALGKLDRALRDLKKAARIPLFRAHLLALEGHRALLVGDHARARRRFRDARVLGERETAPWVLVLVARGEAHLLRREGRQEAALDQARVAALLTREHGAARRLRWIEEEFGIEAVASAPSSAPESTRSTVAAARHRQLRALLDVVRAGGREQQVEPQVRLVLDELLRLTDAWRGLVLFERGGVERSSESTARVMVGRARDAVDWAPTDTRWHDRLQRVCDSGEPESRTEVGGDDDGVPSILVPLELHDTIVGALYLERRSGDLFGPDDVELIRTLTPQVATTLELARLLEDREQLHASLRQAQKMEAVGQLASGVAHDFNNSLMAISSAASELARPGPLDERDHDLIGIIRDSSDRAARLTRQLLAFSRRQVLEFTTMDVGAIVAALEPVLRRLIGDGIELYVLLPEEPCWVKTDRTSLENAILNLVVNARDAMPTGGTVTITVSEAELDEAWIPRGASGTGRHVRIAVEDTGTGIAPEIIDRIFDPFYTTKQVGDGTGLGLASLYGFVKQSGGCVDVYSKVDVGSEFAMYLPSAESTAGAVSVSPTRGPSPGEPRQATILLVDDEPLVRRALARTLRADGYVVQTAAHGGEALDKLQAEGPFDLIIADVLMPVLSGPELASRLAEAEVAVPILFISGYPDGTLVDDGVLRSGVEFLQKPFDNDVLKARVAQLLGS